MYKLFTKNCRAYSKALLNNLNPSQSREAHQYLDSLIGNQNFKSNLLWGLTGAATGNNYSTVLYFRTIYFRTKREKNYILGRFFDFANYRTASKLQAFLVTLYRKIQPSRYLNRLFLLLDTFLGKNNNFLKISESQDDK